MSNKREIETTSTVQVTAEDGELITVTFEEYAILLKKHFDRLDSPTYRTRPRPTANCNYSRKPEGCSFHRVWAGGANECSVATANLTFPKSPENANLLAECNHHQ